MASNNSFIIRWTRTKISSGGHRRNRNGGLSFSLGSDLFKPIKDLLVQEHAGADVAVEPR